MTTIEDDIHILAKKLDRLENRVEHVVDKVVELGERSPSPELDDLARLKRDLRKGKRRGNILLKARLVHVDATHFIYRKSILNQITPKATSL